jgi:hypothetical protein
MGALPNTKGSNCSWQSFKAAALAKPAQATPESAKATLASSDDPDGLLRLERSHAQTPKGFKRLANAIMRDAIGIPLTRKQRAEKSPPKLDPKEIDKNSYRAPVTLERSPREMRNRRKPGWIDCKFVLPRVSLEGLRLLAITSAAGEPRLAASGKVQAVNSRGLERRSLACAIIYCIDANRQKVCNLHGVQDL